MKSGTGTLTISGPNTGQYTGGLTVNAGTLDYSGGVLPIGDYAIVGGTLNIGALSQSIGTFQITGGAVSGTGTLTSTSLTTFRPARSTRSCRHGRFEQDRRWRSHRQRPNLYRNDDVSAGTLNFTGGLPGGAYTITGGTLNIGSLSQSIGAFQITGGTVNGAGTLTSNAAYDIQAGTVNAVLAGSVGLNKTTAGSATVNAPTYTGDHDRLGRRLELHRQPARRKLRDLRRHAEYRLARKSIGTFQITGGTVTGTGTLNQQRRLRRPSRHGQCHSRRHGRSDKNHRRCRHRQQPDLYRNDERLGRNLNFTGACPAAITRSPAAR